MSRRYLSGPTLRAPEPEHPDYDGLDPSLDGYSDEDVDALGAEPSDYGDDE